MSNGSTASNNRMKILTDKMKTPPGETPVVSDNTNYAIPGAINANVSSMYDNFKMPTSNSTSSSDTNKASNMSMNKTAGKLISKENSAKPMESYKKITSYKKGENPNKPPVAKEETKRKRLTGAGGAKLGTSTHYANLADQMVHDYDSILKKDGFSMFDTKMKTHYMKQGMDYRQKASDEFDADFNKWSSDTTGKIKRPNKSDY